jgi:thioredoxin 1
MTKHRASWRRSITLVGVVLLGAIALSGCGESAPDADSASASAAAHSAAGNAKVTFVELGSDKCIPCKEMRPVMDAIQAAFGEQIEIVFYDVWEDQSPAEEYGIQYIPTQVFLDEDGEEFHRHTGFYPQEEIEALLIEHGLEKVATP